MDGTALYKVSSAKRSWSGWISPAINQSTTTSCQSIIDGAVLGEVCLRALWAKLRLYIITTLQSTYHVHRRFRRSVLMDALVPTVMTSLIYAGAFWDLRPCQSIIDNPIVGECLSRGRPQGGRAMNSNVEFDSDDGSSSSSIVNSFSVSEFDADFDRATHFLTPSRVESIGKRLI